ncbi:MAG: hypothetical protein HC897_17320 [Thermoanaerobaculia bacterium]|nr:hypothetical protein [Thermoanaerobaculia bacterium]
MTTTIALPAELLSAVDTQSKTYGGRSGFIAAAIRAFLGRPTDAEIDARDRAIIERHRDELNAEAMDALEYQVPL